MDFFVGRNAEFAQIRALLQKTDCRLLTIVGAGGVGKTSLARHLLREFIADKTFADGVYIVDLQPLLSEKLVPFAIAETLGLNLQNPQNVTTELIAHLQSKHLLLILDNFEHLLNATSLLSQILETASDVKLLITSREVLNMRAEWVFRLAGLTFPALDTVIANEPDSGLTDYEAVKLFVGLARRSNAAFELADELPSVLALCRLTEGLPLALEIVASNLKFMSCEALLQQYRHNLTLVETRLRDVPARHRSMRAVLETSWQLLSPSEKITLGKLSVFQSSFSAEAAHRIAGCELNMLLVLCEKSLVQTLDHERFYLHGLLRDYACAYLSPTQTTDLYADFAAYYAEYVINLTRDIGGFRESAAARQMALQLDNIRFAWNWLLKQQNFAQIPAFAYALFVFYENRNRLAEATELFADSVQFLPPPGQPFEVELGRAVLWGYLGWFYQTSDLQKAEDFLKHSVALFGALDAALPSGPDPQITLARVYEARGNYADALRLATDRAKYAHARQDAYNEAFALYLTSRVFYSQSNYVEGKEYARAAYGLYKKIDSLGSIIGCLTMLAAIARAQRNFLEAGEYAAESLEIAQKLDDKQSMGASLAGLAASAYEEGDYARAREMYHQSADLMEEIGSRVNTPLALEGVGKACVGMGAYGDAARCLLQALQLAVAVSNEVAVTQCVSTFGGLMAQNGQLETATTLLGFLLEHPATLKCRRKAAAEVLLECAAKLPPETYRTALASGQTSSLETIVGLVKHYHRLPFSTRVGASTPASGQKLLALPALTLEADEELIEALTAREMEVLALLQAGATNGQIAEKLYLSVGTVKTHNYNIFSKMGVKNRIQAINRAKVLKLLPEA